MLKIKKKLFYFCHLKMLVRPENLDSTTNNVKKILTIKLLVL